MTTFEKEKILDQLKSLKNLPQVKEVKALKKRLQLELDRLTEEKPVKVEILKKDTGQVNARRSSFMKGVWRLVRLIYFNYPEIHDQYSLKDVFLMYFKRRKGEKTGIDDVYWQNPSL